MEEQKRGTSFENLEVWKEGCDIAVDVYKIASEGSLRKDYGLRDQMTRAAVSVPSNIAEGKERETVPELIRFLFFAKGSCGELRTQLHIARKIKYIGEEEFEGLNERIMILSKKLGSLIRTLKKR